MSFKEEQIIDLNQKINRLYAILFHLSKYVGWQELETIGLGLKNSPIEQNEVVMPLKFPSRLAKLSEKAAVASEGEQKQPLIAEVPPEIESGDDEWQEVAQIMRDGHKDILNDTNVSSQQHSFVDSVYHEDNTVSCEDKVQRLTAQLTVAYNRIAHLEEQLLARRQHSETRQNGFHFHH